MGILNLKFRQNQKNKKIMLTDCILFNTIRPIDKIRASDINYIRDKYS